MRRRVLVTGAAGYVAGQLLPALRQRYELRLTDVRDTNRQGERVAGTVVHDLSHLDLERHRHLFADLDAVVHLAYNSTRRHSEDPTERYLAERVNLDLAFNVYQLALEEGVRRVVVASSNHAADWYEHPIHKGLMDRVDPDRTRPLSDNFYGWVKEAYEHLGFVYASGSQGRKLEVVQIRIGAPREITGRKYEGDPATYKRDLGAYISPRDLRQLFVKSIEADRIDNEWGIPFQVFYGISGNTRAFWSIVNARRVIGYAPADDSEVKYADDIRRLLLSSLAGGEASD